MPYGTVNVDTVTTSTAGGILGAGNASIMKNRIINGAMVIDQRNAGASVTPAHTAYFLDRWTTIITQNNKYTVQQNAGSVTPPVGFTKYMGLTSASAYSVISSDYFIVMQKIEGFNVADLAWGTADAKTVTLSFWTRSSLTGTFGGCLSNSGWARNFGFTYTINSANTWEYKTVTVTGDTTGTWDTSTGQGLILNFSLGAGSGFTNPAGSWTSSYAFQSSGCVNLVGTNGATLYLTGVQLEVGASATGFEYVNYQTSLANCQRYYAKLQSLSTFGGFGSGAWFSSTQCNIIIKYPQALRSAPTVGYGGNVSCMINGGTQVNITGTGTVFAGSDSCMIQPSGLSGATTGQGTTMSANNDSTAFIFFSSEL